MPCDFSKYPLNWKEIRHRILQRAGEVRNEAGKITLEARCEKCGALNHSLIFRGKLHGYEVFQYSDASIYFYPSGEFYGVDIYAPIEPINGDPNQKAHKVVLTIAHLDHDEENHDVKDERLQALCQKCHLRYDTQEKMKRKAKKKYSASIFPL